MHVPEGTIALSKTPTRVPFAGGLTDLKPYAHRYGGVTVSCTIDRYVYVTAKRNHEDFFNLRYLDVHEKQFHVSDIEHDLIREVIKLLKLENIPLDITITTDMYTESGLGSSGAVTVGLLNALHTLTGSEVDEAALLEEAATVEVDILQGASGYHDPAISTFGGFRLIEYCADGITSRPIPMTNGMRKRFAQSLLFFFSGVHNKSKPSLHVLMSEMDTVLPVMHRIREIGYDLEDAFKREDMKRIAAIIGEQQVLKQRLPGNFVDDYVLDVTAKVRDTGASAQIPGGKISAFVIVCCPDSQHDAVRSALPELKEVPIRLVDTGTRAVIV
jgi:D-glycero-alpha-D-manno-heptose-7-phosphate kinase